jgi:nifR3 family TIM-barrel protein
MVAVMTATTTITQPATGGLTFGSVRSSLPVVLAPMAGVTNAAYRQLCREQAELGVADVLADTGAAPARNDSARTSDGLFVCEMVTSRGIVERDPKSLAMLAFDPGERTRSVQLYGVDPATMAEATRIICGEFGVAHVDLNFGCPVPKVTRRGGGAVLPYKRNLLGAILRAVVGAAAGFGAPVTMKTRMGIDDAHLTYLDAGVIAADSGAAAIALHARTAEEHYSGTAHWEAIGSLVAAVEIPVLGNGDIWSAADAVEMMRVTGCAGVVVGRGCLGRPWLFRDLARATRPGSATTADAVPVLPTLGDVSVLMRRHAVLLCEVMGEDRGCRDFRKHVSWYLKGFPVGGELRAAGGLVSSLADLDAVLARLDPALGYPAAEVAAPRGRQGSPKRVVLPAGWLEDTDGVGLDLTAAETDVSGG